MKHRSSNTHDVGMVTRRMLGCFLNDADSRKQLLSLMKKVEQR